MMKPEQVEKVRGHVMAAQTMMRQHYNPPIDRELAAALTALNGEQKEEVWFAYQYESGQWAVAVEGVRMLADSMNERDARRIARLPALEKAARRIADNLIVGNIANDCPRVEYTASSESTAGGATAAIAERCAPVALHVFRGLVCDLAALRAALTDKAGD